MPPSFSGIPHEGPAQAPLVWDPSDIHAWRLAWCLCWWADDTLIVNLSVEVLFSKLAEVCKVCEPLHRGFLVILFSSDLLFILLFLHSLFLGSLFSCPSSSSFLPHFVVISKDHWCPCRLLLTEMLIHSTCSCNTLLYEWTKFAKSASCWLFLFNLSAF